MKQTRAFNPAIAGTIHNFCLDNVRKGFGIDNKYASAWEAWTHTQQHTETVPDGLDVPLFYSYTADIDGVSANYGHINVRLKDGTVWSDGTIYANLDAYLYNHFPQYVGWGESVNDFQIIEGGTMPDPNAELADLRLGWLNEIGALVSVGAPVDGNSVPQIVANIQAQQGQIDSLTKLAEDRESQIKDLQAQLASGSPLSTPSTPPITTPTPVDTPTDPAGQGSVTVTQSGLWAAFKRFLGIK